MWNAIDTIAAQLQPATSEPATAGHDAARRLSGQDGAMKVHLVDGTYELFRQNFGRLAKEPDAGPFAATVGVLRSTLQLLADGATHVARGQRPRHRELPQRPVAGLQDERRDAARAAGPDPDRRGRRSRRWA